MIEHSIVVRKEIKFNPVAVFTQGGMDELLKDIEEQALSFVTTVDTVAGRKEIASIAYKVAQTKTEIDRQRKRLVSEDKERIKKIDAVGKKAVDFLDGLKSRIRKPLDDWEAAEKKRVDNFTDRICAIKDLANNRNIYMQVLTSTELKSALEQVNSLVIDETWEEFREEADRAKADTKSKLIAFIGEAEKREKEASELERLRKAEAERIEKEKAEKLAAALKIREDRIAKEAEERAKKAAQEEAEKKIREERDRAEKAEREKAEAEARHKRELAEAEARAKAEAEKKERDRLAEEARIKAEAEKKASNLRHQKAVQEKAIECFEQYGFSADSSKLIVMIIHENKIDGVSINY